MAKVTYPADRGFAVDVPDLDVENVEPGTTIDVPDGTPADVVASLVAQGWEPDRAARKIADEYEAESARAGEEPSDAAPLDAVLEDEVDERGADE